MLRPRIKWLVTLLVAPGAIVVSGCIGSGGSDGAGGGTGNASAVRVSFESGNELLVDGLTRYEQPWTVLVTDANGNPVADASVTLSIRPLFYFKGRWIPVDTDGDGTDDRWGKGYDSNNDGNIDMVGTSFACLSEDRRLDGVTGFGGATFNGSLDTEDANGNCALDAGEDINGNGILDTEDVDCDDQLEPSVDATVSPSTVLTGSNGFADFSLVYPKGNATWSFVRIEAQADVQGTEGSETRDVGLRVLVEDISNLDVEPPGPISGPYGEVGDCTVPG